MHKFLANGRLWGELVRQTGVSHRAPFALCTRVNASSTTSAVHLYNINIRKQHSGSNEESPKFIVGSPKGATTMQRPVAVPLAVPLSIVPQIVDAKGLISEISKSGGLPTGSNASMHPLPLIGDESKEPVVASVTSLPGLKRLIYHYLMLSKIRLTSLVVLTTMAGYAMAPGSFELGTFLLCSVGTTLVSGAANSVNQVIETSFDAQMARTRNRVLVKGYLSRLHAVGFALSASTIGCSMLYCGVNEMTALLGAANLILYTSIYTPMKRYSILNTWVGSIVGAIPPLMGWAACTGGDLGAGAWILAGLLYCWQFPHFNALSWNIRPEYLKAGYKMMANSHPALCTRVSLRHTGFITGLSLLAPALDVTNAWFALETLPLNAYFAYLAWDFHQKADSKSSRKLFRFSLLHLPLLMGLFLLNKKNWLFNEDKNEGMEQINSVGANASVSGVFVNGREAMGEEGEYVVPNIVAEISASSTPGSIKAIEDSLLSNVTTVLPTTGKQKL